MNLTTVERITSAVLYEGYILYPYRASAVKNRQRFNFGALFPEAYSREQRGTEPWSTQTECLLRARTDGTVRVRVRFLHLLAREVGKPSAGAERSKSGEPCYQLVDSLEVNGRLFQTWQEAIEREVDLGDINLDDLLADGRRTFQFGFPSGRTVESLFGSDGSLAGVIIRTQGLVAGAVEVAAQRAGALLYKLSVRIKNLSAAAVEELSDRDAALMRSLVSAHTVLTSSGGEFVSLLDPPEEARAAAAACENVGTWPVLVGEEGERDCMLSSPIILYDYPQIAPESAGDLFDGTEIDEILTLRILTLTDDEKRQMRGVDERARRILERSENIAPEDFMRLHGAVRSLRRTEDERLRSQQVGDQH